MKIDLKRLTFSKVWSLGNEARIAFVAIAILAEDNGETLLDSVEALSIAASISITEAEKAVAELSGEFICWKGGYLAISQPVKFQPKQLIKSREKTRLRVAAYRARQKKGAK